MPRSGADSRRSAAPRSAARRARESPAPDHRAARRTRWGPPGGGWGGVRAGAGGGSFRARPKRARAPVLLDPGGPVVVAGGTHHTRHVGVVLGRAADHGRPADIDVLHAFGVFGITRDRVL